jgi:hypothetical protein
VDVPSEQVSPVHSSGQIQSPLSSSPPFIQTRGGVVVLEVVGRLVVGRPVVFRVIGSPRVGIVMSMVVGMAEDVMRSPCGKETLKKIINSVNHINKDT